MAGQLSSTAQAGGKFLIEGDVNGDGAADIAFVVASGGAFDGNEFAL